MSGSNQDCYVELKVAAVELKGRRVDPFVVLFRGDSDSPELGRTEVVWSESSPAFVTGFEVPYDEQDLESQFRMVVYNKTSRSEELRKNSFLGYAEFSLERVFSKTDGIIERVLRSKGGKNDGKRGKLIICGERVLMPSVKHMFSIQFGFSYNSHAWGPESGKKARKAFYVIYRAIINGVADEDWTPVYRSEIVDPYQGRGQDLMFEGASIRAEHLYGMDENRGLRFELFHYSSSGPHVPLGFVQTSASAFKYAKPGGKLYMVPVPASTMKSAHVSLDMAKIGLTTRQGGVSSVFCLKASGFTWGLPGEGLMGDDYLERDAYGRTRIEFLDGYVPGQGLPRGVSYMSRKNRKGPDSDDGADSEMEG